LDPEIEYVLNKDEIEKRIPHRHSFSLLDGITELIPNDFICAHKHLYGEDEFLKGHFPGNPVMPGVLTVESLAQAAGVLIHESVDADEKKFILYLVGIESCRFKSPIYPVCDIFLHAKLESKRKMFWKFRCKAIVNEKVMAEVVMIQAPGKYI
jgi:3-hydroxyacyl-[acyl-carrier-protein] dehydratase